MHCFSCTVQKIKKIKPFSERSGDVTFGNVIFKRSKISERKYARMFHFEILIIYVKNPVQLYWTSFWNFQLAEMLHLVEIASCSFHYSSSIIKAFKTRCRLMGTFKNFEMTPPPPQNPFRANGLSRSRHKNINPFSYKGITSLLISNLIHYKFNGVIHTFDSPCILQWGKKVAISSVQII